MTDSNTGCAATPRPCGSRAGGADPSRKLIRPDPVPAIPREPGSGLLYPAPQHFSGGGLSIEGCMDHQRILRFGVEHNASDVHMRGGRPPNVRFGGTPRALEHPPVSDE